MFAFINQALAPISPPRRSLASWLLLALFGVIVLGACTSKNKEDIAAAPADNVQGSSALQLAAVESINVQMLESFPVQVQVIARGTLPDDCTHIENVETVRVGNQFHVAIFSQRQQEEECRVEAVPFEQMIRLQTEGLSAGTYSVDVNGVTDSFELSVDNSLRAAEIAPTSVPEAPVSQPPPASAAIPQVAYVAQGMLAAQLNVSPGAITIEDVTAQTWPDTCLGLAQPDEACVQQLTPGYAIVLNFADQRYIYHTDEQGKRIRSEAPKQSPLPSEATTGTPTEDCTNQAEFVADVTVKDKTRIAGNQSFMKTWRLRNIGTCTWTPDYQVVWTGGDVMSEQKAVALGQTVAPGEKVDVSVRLVAPAQRGSYRSSWQLQAPNGQLFGIGRKGSQAFWVNILVPQDATRKASIEGVIWHDVCDNSGLSAESPPPGCRILDDGSYLADGVRDEAERPIGDAIVSLAAGSCPGTEIATTRADANGHYVFADLPAGDYCVSIDPASSHNEPIFIPGAWSYPADGYYSIRLGPAETRKELNFGWDYQFAP